MTTIRPTGNGAINSWTPSAGANWQCVDEATVSDTDFVSAVGGGIDLYSHSTTITLPPDKLVFTLRLKSTANSPINLILYHPTYGYLLVAGIIAAVPTTSFVNYTLELTTNPYTGLPWTIADVTGLQWGPYDGIGGRTSTMSQTFVDTTDPITNASLVAAKATMTVAAPNSTISGGIGANLETALATMTVASPSALLKSTDATLRAVVASMSALTNDIKFIVPEIRLFPSDSVVRANQTHPPDAHAIGVPRWR